MDYQIGKKYEVTLDSACVPSFDSVYDDVKLVGILSYEEAVKQDDIVTKHQAISAKKTFNINIKIMTFLKFETKSNGYIIIAKEYISSSRELSTIDLTITISSINTNDLDIIKSALEDLGYLDAVYNKRNI